METINTAVRKAIDQGCAAQLASSQEDLIYRRTSAGFGCVEHFAYTEKPAIVERSRQLTVEAEDAEWTKSKATLQAIIDSFKPVG